MKNNKKENFPKFLLFILEKRWPKILRATTNRNFLLAEISKRWGGSHANRLQWACCRILGGWVADCQANGREIAERRCDYISLRHRPR